jgi:hypothetical protein
MRAAARESTVLLYSPSSDPFLDMKTDYSNRVFYLEEDRTLRRCLLMGRSFESVRLGVQQVSVRWAMVRKHSSKAFYALDDPLEAAVFSALMELLKKDEGQSAFNIDPVATAKLHNFPNAVAMKTPLTPNDCIGLSKNSL